MGFVSNESASFEARQSIVRFGKMRLTASSAHSASLRWRALDFRRVSRRVWSSVVNLRWLASRCKLGAVENGRQLIASGSCFG